MVGVLDNVNDGVGVCDASGVLVIDTVGVGDGLVTEEVTVNDIDGVLVGVIVFDGVCVGGGVIDIVGVIDGVIDFDGVIVGVRVGEFVGVGVPCVIEGVCV